MTYVLNEYGEIEKTDQEFKNGRYRMIEGKLVRVADGTRGPVHYAGSDSLGEGVRGVFNPADGKTYDSRSAYINAVKSKGLVIAGDDAPTTRATPKAKTENWEKAVAQTLKQTPLKGKKR